MGPPKPTDSVMSELDESRVCDLGKVLIEINSVTKHDMRQCVVASSDNEDRTYLERKDLDTHTNMVVLGINYYVVNNLGKVAEVRLFSPEYEALKFPIVNAVMQCDNP